MKYILATIVGYGAGHATVGALLFLMSLSAGAWVGEGIPVKLGLICAGLSIAAVWLSERPFFDVPTPNSQLSFKTEG